jgi:hypothetical protein
LTRTEAFASTTISRAEPAAESAVAALAAEHILTTKEAARIARLSPRTLMRLRSDGGGPPFVFITPNGSRIGYESSALKTWLAARTFAHTSAATVGATGISK